MIMGNKKYNTYTVHGTDCFAWTTKWSVKMSPDVKLLAVKLLLSTELLTVISWYHGSKQCVCRVTNISY